jgi:hypothetical protein
MVKSFNIPDVSSDWMSSNRRAVVLLKQIAGTVQAGNLKLVSEANLGPSMKECRPVPRLYFRALAVFGDHWSYGFT